MYSQNIRGIRAQELELDRNQNEFYDSLIKTLLGLLVTSFESWWLIPWPWTLKRSG
jgi:hypothetical protein